MTTSERKCAECAERPARHGRRCWRCAKPYTKKGGKIGGPHAPGWDNVPYGHRFTLSEIAALTGMKRSSVAAYAQPGCKRHLPPGFKIIRQDRYLIFIIREEEK